MYGFRLWQSNLPVFGIDSIDEAKDTLPLGTIKKYGEKHLYVKVGGKKPWVYYATLGTEKSDAAFSAGGVVVVDGKAVGPATPENLAKHGVEHPSKGAPVASGAPAAGIVSAPALPVPEPVVEPEPEKPAFPKKPLILTDVNSVYIHYLDLTQQGHDNEEALSYVLDAYDDVLSSYGVTPKQALALMANLGMHGSQSAFASVVGDVAKRKALVKMASENGFKVPLKTVGDYPKANTLNQVLGVLSSMEDEGHPADDAVNALADVYQGLLGDIDLPAAKALALAADVGLQGAQKVYDSYNEHPAATKWKDAVKAIAAKLGAPIPKDPEPKAADLKGVFAEMQDILSTLTKSGFDINSVEYENAGQDTIEKLAAKYKDVIGGYGTSPAVVLNIAFEMHRKGPQAVLDTYEPPFTPGSFSEKMSKLIPKLADELGMPAPKAKQVAPKWAAGIPHPQLALDGLSGLIKMVDDSGLLAGDFAQTSDGKALAATFGKDMPAIYNLAKQVQSFSVNGTDPDALVKYASSHPAFEKKMIQMHGASWKEKATAFGKALASVGKLAPSGPVTPIVAPKKKTFVLGADGTSIGDVAEIVAKTGTTVDLLKNKPEIATIMAKRYGGDWMDAAYTASLFHTEPEKAFASWAGVKGPDAQRAYKIAADMGLTMSLDNIAGGMKDDDDLGEYVDDLSETDPHVKDHLRAYAPKDMAMGPADVAFYAYAISKDVDKVVNDYAHFSDDSATKKVISDVAKGLGKEIVWPDPDEVQAPPDDDTEETPPAPLSLGSFKNKILNMGFSEYNIDSTAKGIEAESPGILSGYKSGTNPEEDASPSAVLRVARHILNYGVEDAIPNWYSSMDEKSVKKLAKALGVEVPDEAAPGDYTISALVKSRLSYLKSPKKGEAYQALKKLGYDHESPEAKVAVALHKFQNKKVVKGWLEGKGLPPKDTDAILAAVINKAAATGAFTMNGEGVPTFPELKSKKKKKSVAGAEPVSTSPSSSASSSAATFAAYSDDLIDAVGWPNAAEALAAKIQKSNPGALEGYTAYGGQKTSAPAVVMVAANILKHGLEKTVEGFSHLMNLEGMKKLEALVKPTEELEDEPSAETSKAVQSVMPSEIPPMSSLKLKGDAKHLGGAGQKAVYVDAAGKEYLFKVAANKAGTKVEPARAEVQAAFSKIARMIKKEHPPIGVTTVGGKLGTIYPFIEADGNLKGITPSKLTATQRFDVAVEHILDWMGSQHDSHSANLLRTPGGRIIAIDKEQGFKYFPNDKLDISYHPNGQYGESEPYYNTFWRDWSENKVEFDPKFLDNVIKSAEAISGPEYMDTLRPYAQNRYPGDLYAQEKFLRLALNRKLTLRRDYEKFLSGLYKKKTGVEGSFTFDNGWKPDGEALKPIVKLVTLDAETYAGQQSVRIKPFKKNDGTEDPTKLTLKVAKGSVSDLEDFLKTMKVDALEPVKQGSQYSMVYVNAAQFKAASLTKELVIQPEDQTKVQPHPGTPKYITAPEMLERVTPNSSDLKSIESNKTLGIGGKRITLDGPAVEGQVAKVKRRKDSKGVYYDVNFKLRKTTWSGITGGDHETYSFRTGTYDEASDTLTASGTSTSTSSRRWTVGDSQVDLVTGSQAFKGGVYARVKPKKGQSVEEALAELLDKMKPGLAKEIIKDPTDEERELVKMARLLSAVAPQTHDKIPEAERTADVLRAKLSKQGWKKDRLADVAEVETIPGHATHIAPGLWKEAKTSNGDPALRFLYWGVSTPARIGQMLKGGGIMGIHERIMAGKEDFGASASSDIESGGADNVTLRMAVASGDNQSFGSNNNVGGKYQIIVAPDECDRLDTHLALGDSYGSTTNEYWTGRKSMATQIKKFNDDPYKSNVEIVIRRGISSKKFLRICASDEDDRVTLIKELKSQGIEDVNGVPVEDFVVVETTKGGAYKKFVKPAGF